jgi:hypothetical protein
MFQNQGKPSKNSGYSPTFPIPSWKWDDISMDFIVGLPFTSRNHDSIWVVVDRLTKTAHFIAVNNTYSAKDYAEIYLDRVVRLHGILRPSFLIEVLNLYVIFGNSYTKTWEQS